MKRGRPTKTLLINTAKFDRAMKGLDEAVGSLHKAAYHWRETVLTLKQMKWEAEKEARKKGGEQA